jgi:hypothetical protein
MSAGMPVSRSHKRPCLWLDPRRTLVTDMSSKQGCWLLRANKLSGEGIAFDVEQLVESPDVALFVRELS